MKRMAVGVLTLLVFLTGTFLFAGQASAERFVNHNNGTVTDTQTGLMWAAQDNGSDINWYGAKSYCEGFSGADNPAGGCPRRMNW